MRLFWKLFFALWLSIMGFAVIMVLVNNHLARPQQQEVPDQAVQEVDALAERLTAALNRNGAQAARRLLRNLPRRVAGHVFLLDENGVEMLGRQPALERLERAGVATQRRVLSLEGGRVLTLVVARRPSPPPVLDPGSRGVLLRLLIAALVSALVSGVLARYLARPLSHLGLASQRLAEGDLATRVGTPLTGRRDEFGSLARDIDHMATKLDQMQTANRRLLRDVSHELRSPLARLSVALEIARNRECKPVESELDRIQLECDRLESLIDEVLDLLRESSETQPLSREPFSLAELLEDLQSVVGYEVPERVPGIRIHAEQDVEINANRELIWRALENLVRNALIHTDEQSGVDITLEPSDEPPGATICIGDRGPGLAQQHLEKVFEPFYRAQEARDRGTGGYGLGLAIAAAAVRRHGGTLSARNREGGGLEMVMTLPSA